MGDILSGLPSLLLGFSSSSVVKNLPATQETLVQFQDQEDPLEKGKATQCSILGLPWWLSWYRIPLKCGRPGFDPWVGKSLGEGNGYPLQYSGLEIPWTV